jgi:hypothetical protein
MEEVGSHEDKRMQSRAVLFSSFVYERLMEVRIANKIEI